MFVSLFAPDLDHRVLLLSVRLHLIPLWIECESAVIDSMLLLSLCLLRFSKDLPYQGDVGDPMFVISFMNTVG